MKVIDLLNKIADVEEVPEKIKFEKTIFIYDKGRKDYIHKIDDWASETLLFKVMDCHFIKEILEAEVELIEEDTIDIESIEKIENEVMRDDWRYYVPLFFNKINEIVPAVKQLNRELKELKEDKKCDRKPNVQ